MNRLRERLSRIEGKGYKAYKDIQGTYHGNGFSLYVDYVQPDPFAPPSRIRVEMPWNILGYKKDWIATPVKRISLEDFLTREISWNIRRLSSGQNGTGKSGLIYIDTPGQEILERTSVKVDSKGVEVRLSCGLPARGRTVMSREAIDMFFKDIPEIIKTSLLKFDRRKLENQLQLSEQQEFIRNFLRERGYVCFVANGSILPRESGISNKPLRTGAVPFKSPSSLEIEIPIPYSAPIRGMALGEGITLIVGGGYHGKSTLLHAIERGIYNHVSGDGREYVITDPTAFKIRAEYGRSVRGVDISPFISRLPFEKDTSRFSTEDASGSTSQAANIMEALESGSRLLLLDEDTSATNFMIRDGRMQALVPKDKEPITPFIDKVTQLYRDHGVSSILVIGGSGDYLDVADRVVMMDEYLPFDVTDRAREVSRSYKNERVQESGKGFVTVTQRVILKSSLIPSDRRGKVDTKGLHTILYGGSTIDLSLVEQLVDPSQTRAIAYMLEYMAKNLLDNSSPLSEVIDKLYNIIEENGLDVISPYYGMHPGDLALPRKLELAAAINRLRNIKVK